ncbi:MAG: hypothetical protein ACRDG4_11720, partial [Chloroflexota bacterium]
QFSASADALTGNQASIVSSRHRPPPLRPGTETAHTNGSKAGGHDRASLLSPALKAAGRSPSLSGAALTRGTRSSESAIGSTHFFRSVSSLILPSPLSRCEVGIGRRGNLLAGHWEHRPRDTQHYNL